MLKRILIALILLSPLYLMSVNAIAQENSSSGLFSKLQQLGIKLGQSNPQELLPPDEAFKISVEVRDGQTLVANLTPAKDYYLYRDKIIFESKETDTAIENFLAAWQEEGRSNFWRDRSLLRTDSSHHHVETRPERKRTILDACGYLSRLQRTRWRMLRTHT